MIARDENGVAHIVGLSGGKDSTAMSLALIEREPRPYTFVCTPTGLKELRELFEAGKIPERSLKGMARDGMCRACTM